MDKPFILLVIATISGILLSYYFNMKIGIILMLLGLFVILFLFNIIKEKGNTLNIFILFLLIGMMTTVINKNSKLVNIVGHRNDYTGIVQDIINLNETEGKYIILVEKLNNSMINEKIVLKVTGNKSLELGDRIEFNGILNLPLRNTNPMLYNHKLNLLSDKIHTTMSIKDYSISNITSTGLLKYRVKAKFKDDVKSLFDKHLNSKNSNLIRSIILGKSSYLDEEDLIKYRDLGLAHILAVSGLHIGIISGFLLFIFSRLGLKRKYNFLLTLSIIWFYGYLLDYSPSTLRASIMFSILFYSMSIHEPYDSLNTISFAMLISLLINPFWLFSISFQLSFIATISIIILTPKIAGFFYPYKGKTLQSLVGIIGVNIGLLPVHAYYFNKISILGIVANLITIPILSFSLIIGMVMIVFNYSFPIINNILGFILNLLLIIEMYISNMLYGFPVNIVKAFSPDFTFIFLYYILIGIIFKLINIKRFGLKLNKMMIFYLLILILLNSVIINLNDSMEVHFIDVGQGDSILIRTDKSDYLIDTGGSVYDGFDVTKSITLPYLQKLGINKLDAIIITHFDDDHSKGLDLLIKNMKIKNIYSSYIPEDKIKLPITVLKETDSLMLDENIKLEVLWPNETYDKDSLTSNNKSMVLMLAFKDYQILFTGDIEKDVEEKISDKINGPLDILKVAHHGSITSSTTNFLNRTMPVNSVISVGRNNFYNHPNKEVLERLKDIDSNIFRTDEMGLIKVLLSKKGIEIIPYLNDYKTGDVSLPGFINEYKFYIIFYILYYILSYFLVIMYRRITKELILIEL